MHKLRIVHIDSKDRPGTGFDLSERAVVGMYQWVNKCLRLRDNAAARKLHIVLHSVLFHRGYDKGRTDNSNGVDRRTSISGLDPERSGYRAGWEAAEAEAQRNSIERIP